MKVDAIGVLDFQRHTLEIDATIRRGVVMGLFKISGDGGVRSSWGDTPYLMATLGGFHPKFHPEPAVFPKLNRILITVDKSHLPDAVELSASGYMAVTSNTIQFGATFTASIKSGNWKIEGSIGGDALIRQPFAFDVEIRGGVHVKYRGHNLIGVSFKGGLAGPDPLVLRGEVCISLLLFDACWRDSFQLGGDDISGPVIASLVPVLADEMTRASNLTVSADDDKLVLLRRDEEPPPRPVLSPLGVVTWSQNRMPLGLEIDTFEDGKLAKAQRVEVHASVPTDAFLDWFSPGTFVELEESEELALPAFERQQAGVTVKPPVDPRATPTTVPVSYEEIRLPSPIRHIVDGLADPGARARADGGDGRAAVDPSRPDPLHRRRGGVHGRDRDRDRRARRRGRSARRRPHHVRRQAARGRPAGGGGVGMSDVSFFGWWQPPGAAAVSSATLHDGRLSAALQLTASDLDRPSDSATRTAVYDLLGPRDATGLAAAAVVHTYPSPGAQNVELNKAVYAELAAPDLPWRHTVNLPQGKALRPWIVLLVGTADEIEVAGDRVRLQPSVLDAHPLVGFGAGRARRAGAGRPSDRAPDLAARAHARPRPRRGDRAGVHHGRDAGVGDAGRRDGRARALPPLALPHEIRRRLRRARTAAEAPPGGEPRRRRCHLRPAAGGDDPGRRRARLQVDAAAGTAAAGGTGRPRGAHRRARRRCPSGRRAPRPRRAVAACASPSGRRAGAPRSAATTGPGRWPDWGTPRRSRTRSCSRTRPGGWPAPTRRSPTACAGWRWDCSPRSRCGSAA